MSIYPTFWQGKRVLITGHTGFKGAWFSLWLNRLGAKVAGLSLPPAAQPNLYELVCESCTVENFFCDIRDIEGVKAVFSKVKPEIVFHLAAQALVRTGYAQPIETFAVNTLGTANVLEAMRGHDGLRVVVAVTTDKVYKNREWVYPYRESDPLGGHDPYSASKAAAELVIKSYSDSFLQKQGVAVSSARAGNVIGGGDWAQDRLLPDALRAWSSGQILEIRKPNGVRPWQHVLDPLAGYMRLAEKLWNDPSCAGPYNFGPLAGEAATVRAVVEMARKAFGHGDVAYASESSGPHEAGLLTLETSKAKSVLDVFSKWSLQEAVSRTVLWHRLLQEGRMAADLCNTDITAYEGS